MNQKEIKFNIKLTHSQQKVYNYIHDPNVTYVVTRFSRQCGKTVIAELLLIESFLRPTFNIYISPTYAQGSKVYKEITQILGPTGLIKKANAGTLEIESIYGGTIKFFSMQSPTAIRGNTVKRGLLVLDECAFFPDVLPDGSQPWSSVIYPIVKAYIKENKVLFISTPKGKRGLLWEAYRNALSQRKGWVELKATIYDDELIDAEEIELLKQSMDPIAFQEEFLVEFLDSSLTYFIGFDECFHNFDFNWQIPLYVGIDWATSGSDQTVLTFINQIGQVHSMVIDGTLDQMYQKIAQEINSHPNIKMIYAESNSIGTPMLNEVQKLLKNKNILKEFYTSNSSKLELISDLAMVISKKEITFNNQDTQLYEQLSTFGIQYTKTGKMQFIGLNSTHDDKVMSLAFALKAFKDSNIIGNYVLSF